MHIPFFYKVVSFADLVTHCTTCVPCGPGVRVATVICVLQRMTHTCTCVVLPQLERHDWSHSLLHVLTLVLNLPCTHQVQPFSAHPLHHFKGGSTYCERSYVDLPRKADFIIMCTLCTCFCGPVVHYQVLSSLSASPHHLTMSPILPPGPPPPFLETN